MGIRQQRSRGKDELRKTTDLSFIHLHNHSEFSILDGALKIEDLVEAAYENNMPALALTDHGNIFGAVSFFKAAKAKGIKPILGCEMYVAPISRFEKKVKQSETKHFHLILLVVRHCKFSLASKLF